MENHQKFIVIVIINIKINLIISLIIVNIMIIHDDAFNHCRSC